MKFNININQGAINDAGLAGKTDLIDWAIIDYIKDWQANPKAVRFDQMIWLNFSQIIKEMPMLGITSKGAISKRIKKLFDLNLIDVHQESDNRIFVQLTQFAVDVIMFKGSSRKKQGCFPQETGVSHGEQGVSHGKQGVSHGKHSIEHHLSVHQLIEVAEGDKTPSVERPKGEPKSQKTWNAYASAYQRRYNHEPPRNQQINSMLCKLVDFLGVDDAPRVAWYYLTLNKAFYINNHHPVKILLADYQSIYNQMMNNTDQTSQQVRQQERRSNMRNNVDEVIRKIEARANT